MEPITNLLSNLLSNAFTDCGFEGGFGRVQFSKTELCQFQCNDAFAAAKHYKKPPLQIAQAVKEHVQQQPQSFTVEVAPPGFININLSDHFLAEFTTQLFQAPQLGIKQVDQPQKIVIDYGGPNVAKPLHVGHLRSAIIGESIKRIAKMVGHQVIGDVHLGDWGLQMGVIIAYLKQKQPSLPYFNAQPEAELPPLSIHELEPIYPAASALSKQDPAFLEEARQATLELQQGHPKYRLLWKHILEASVADLKLNYAQLDVSFDVWKGESDAQVYIPDMIEQLKEQGFTEKSEGALVVHVSEPTDKTELPPLILFKSDGAVLYSTTDLATILQRITDYDPDYILYVVDKRQSMHFKQVIRCAYKTGIAPEDLQLEHIPFGTMNGKDGKPFRTREGGIMKLSALIQLLVEEAKKRLDSVTASNIGEEKEKQEIAKLVGIAALKFGDLINTRSNDYIFDVEKFCSFEGKTGPYLLYTVVRLKSILKKALNQGLSWSVILAPDTISERNLLVKLLEFQEVLFAAYEKRMPNLLAEYVYSLSNRYNSFYHDNHVMKESNPERQASLLAIMELSLKTMETCLGLLGIKAPERM